MFSRPLSCTWKTEITGGGAKRARASSLPGDNKRARVFFLNQDRKSHIPIVKITGTDKISERSEDILPVPRRGFSTKRPV